MTVAEREALRAALLAEGFDEARFAAVPAEGASAWAEWLAEGHQADMAWMERTAEKRLDPDRVLPGVRSVIVLGVNALPGRGAPGRWANYALYSDYHDTMAAGLRAAGAVLEARLPGLTRDDYRLYVDAGPVVERGWAAAAGLGFQGRNGMLISRRHGNWLLLAAILVRAEIPPDPPLSSRTAGRTVQGSSRPVGLHCGTCTRCLESCPTNAFPRPGWVDARRCISYHTIENRGVIPRELRPGFGGRVFGCDVCLEVCPWNRFAHEGRSRLLAAREAVGTMSLLELLALDAPGFAAAFRGTPIKRAKLAGLLRNACIAAGNWRDSDVWHFGGAEDPAAVAAALERLCGHEIDLVRAHAVWALFRLIGRDEAARRLAGRREQETSAIVLEEYQAADPVEAAATRSTS